jgi:hypothetical protein
VKILLLSDDGRKAETCKITVYGISIQIILWESNNENCLACNMTHGLRVFENRVLRRIFGPKRDEMTGGWRKLHNEKLLGSWTLFIIPYSRN